MKSWAFLVLTSLFFALSCKKNPEPTLISNPCQIDDSFTIHSQYPIIGNPISNPNNPDEIAFLRDKYFSTCCNQEIVIFNQKTKELKSIYNGPILTFDWGKNGWIIFCDNSIAQIFKILPAGDSLTQLTNNGYNSDPKWNKDGTAYISRFTSSDFDSFALRVVSPTGTIINEFNGQGFGYDNCHHDSLIVVLTNSYQNGDAVVNLYSLSDYQPPGSLPFAFNFPVEGAGNYRYCEWINNNEIIVTSGNGIFKLNLSNTDNPKTDYLKASCPKLGYGRLTIVQAFEHLILERYEYEITGEMEAIRNIRFVRMNLDGTGEEVMEIPGL